MFGLGRSKGGWWVGREGGLLDRGFGGLVCLRDGIELVPLLSLKGEILND